jgi:hypothetical protein
MAAAIRQEGNLNSKRLQVCKVPNKTTVRALASRYTRSSKTLIHLLQSLTILREILTPSTTVIILLESS